MAGVQEINWQELSKDERVERLVDCVPSTAKENGNTVKEHVVLQYVDHFREQYEQLFPQRAPLMLSPRNEYKVHVSLRKEC